MQIDEQTLSSVMDGENSTGEILAGVAATTGSRAAWARYHLIGDVLRDNSSVIAPAEFSASIAAQIADEPAILAPQAPTRTALRPVAGFAIAASVATLAVIGIGRMEPAATPGTAPAIAAAPAVNTAPPVNTAPAVNIAPAAATPALASTAPESNALPLELTRDTHPAQRRFNSYLVKFNEQRSNVGVPGVNPYVRIVGFEAE